MAEDKQRMAAAVKQKSTVETTPFGTSEGDIISKVFERHTHQAYERQAKNERVLNAMADKFQGEDSRRAPYQNGGLRNELQEKADA